MSLAFRLQSYPHLRHPPVAGRNVIFVERRLSNHATALTAAVQWIVNNTGEYWSFTSRNFSTTDTNFRIVTSYTAFRRWGLVDRRPESNQNFLEGGINPFILPCLCPPATADDHSIVICLQRFRSCDFLSFSWIVAYTARRFGTYCPICCLIQPSRLNVLGGTWKRISLPDIRDMSALEV